MTASQDAAPHCYPFADIESRAQSDWDRTHANQADDHSDKPKLYCLSMFPYPSGQLHMGHVRNYTIGDVISRHARLLGHEVLQPMGWDAFGLPAENAATQHGISPRLWTERNIDTMREQFKTMGLSFDWSRELKTIDEDYYRWGQWLFVRMMKAGLAYRQETEVNWDPVDQTVLANEQVIDGKGWRSGAPVRRKRIQQWCLKITNYAEELLSDLDQLTEWPVEVKTMQRHWIGRSQGSEVLFELDDNHPPIEVYTTRVDTLMGVTCLLLSPRHPLVEKLAQQNSVLKNFVDICSHVKVSEAALATMEKQGMDLGVCARHPLTDEAIPIWVANCVLMDYGSGAVMAVPAHDSRDAEFAQKYNLPVRPVVVAPVGQEADWSMTDPGVLVDSGEWTGMTTDEAKSAITQVLKGKQRGRRKVQYRLRDWGISRQRYWGVPIPVIYCDRCGCLPVPEADLPVRLPTVDHYDNSSKVLESLPDFYQVVCPQCGGEARRETDTFDTFMDSSWYFNRFPSVDQHEAMADPRLDHWAPVDHYIGGIEHAVLHLLYARFIHTVLRDQGLVSSDEPFKHLLTQGMVLRHGAKMSKSKGNVVSPDDMIQRFGADTLRLFVMFAAPPEQSFEWSDGGVEGCHRFLRRLWTWAMDWQPRLSKLSGERGVLVMEQVADHRAWLADFHQQIHVATQDMARYQYNTVVACAMKMLNAMTKLTPEKTEEPETLMVVDHALSCLLRLLSPFTPHLCHVLWQKLGYGESLVAEASWPEVIADLRVRDRVEMVVQVNGKVRGRFWVARDGDRDAWVAEALALESVVPWLEGKTLKKTIVVPHRLINFVV